MAQVTPPSLSSAGGGVAGAAIFLDQVQARQRHVELGFAGVLEQHEIFHGVAAGDLVEAGELADAVLGVDDEVAELEVEAFGGEEGDVRAGARGFGGVVAGFEEVFAAERWRICASGKKTPRRTWPWTR